MSVDSAARDMAAAGLANAFSSALLNPSDVTKIRLQSPGVSPRPSSPPHGRTLATLLTAAPLQPRLRSRVAGRTGLPRRAQALCGADCQA